MTEHLKHLEIVFGRLREFGLKVHPGKCLFASEGIDFLGHKVSAYGIEPQGDKTEAIRGMEAPKDISGLRAVLGLLSYYRKFVPHFSSKAAPLNKLLKKESTWQWGGEETKALEELKGALCSEPILKRPDFKLPFILCTDLSQQGLGAVLSQKPEGGQEHVVAYASRSCNPAEKNYSSYDGESLVVVWAVRHFRQYLMGSPFTLYTDHRALKWMMSTSELTGRLARWSLMLQEYEFKIIHRPGVDNAVADCCSRMPLPSTEDAGRESREELGKIFWAEI